MSCLSFQDPSKQRQAGWGARSNKQSGKSAALAAKGGSKQKERLRNKRARVLAAVKAAQLAAQVMMELGEWLLWLLGSGVGCACKYVVTIAIITIYNICYHCCHLF